MAVYPHGKKWQARIEHPLLPKKFFVTFEDETLARNYEAHIMQMLRGGVVPLDMLESDKVRAGIRLDRLVPNYKGSSPGPAPSDVPTLDGLVKELGTVRTNAISNRWADEWVKGMKLERNLAPSTIRKRVETLARVLDWYIRETTPKDKAAPVNPLRMLPRGYSNYTQVEAAALKDEQVVKADGERERRFAPGEEARLRAVLAGEKSPERERAWGIDPDFQLLFEVILATGMRLREAYWIRAEHYEADKGLLHVEGTKGHRGAKKRRVVPILPSLRPALKARCEGKTGLIFPFWDGDDESLKKATGRLSARFRTLFDYAEMPDFTEHDLRHEATCRWVTMKDREGRWMWADIEICKIMGWTKLDMLKRYASLRGEDFANRLL